MHRPTADKLLLFLIHSIERATHLFATTSLHLRKDEGVTITADKIHFTSPRSTKVPPKDFPTESFEMSSGCLFTPAP